MVPDDNDDDDYDALGESFFFFGSTLNFDCSLGRKDEKSINRMPTRLDENDIIQTEWVAMFKWFLQGTVSIETCFVVKQILFEFLLINVSYLNQTNFIIND